MPQYVPPMFLAVYDMRKPKNPLMAMDRIMIMAEFMPILPNMATV
jgi:hypothetical protein